jgi:hypothetical protein
MVAIDEVVLAIDPGLRKVEEILLWQNKFKTAGVFTFFHFLFWLFQSFNIRTYCTISCILLAMHLLDAYRTKKRREILRLQQSSKSQSLYSMISIFFVAAHKCFFFLPSCSKRSRFLRCFCFKE